MTKTLTIDERMANVKAHVERFNDILTKRAPEGAMQRIYRTRAIIDNDFIVITLLQNLPGFQPPPNTPDVKLHVFVDRPYMVAAASGGPVVQMAFVGQYSLDELVAFLAFDKVDPESLEWIDETKYSNLVVVGDILRKAIPSR